MYSIILIKTYSFKHNNKIIGRMNCNIPTHNLVLVFNASVRILHFPPDVMSHSKKILEVSSAFSGTMLSIRLKPHWY